MQFDSNPAPVSNDTIPLWTQLKSYCSIHGIALPPSLSLDMNRRDKFGIQKYGTPLQAFNGRSFVQDAYEEALDLAVYLMGLLVEEADNRGVGNHYVDIQVMLDDTLDTLITLSSFLQEQTHEA